MEQEGLEDGRMSGVMEKRSEGGGGEGEAGRRAECKCEELGEGVD